MKKFIILALATILSLGASAQKIIGDNTKDGLRYVATDSKPCRSLSDRIVFCPSLAAAIDEQRHDTAYSIVPEIICATPCEVKKGGRMLLKLFDDSVMELTAFLGDKQTVCKVHDVLGVISKDYTIFPTYKVTLEQIQTIINKGVKKVRIELEPKIYDKEFKKDKVGIALKERLPLLLEKISKPSASFSDGF